MKAVSRIPYNRSCYKNYFNEITFLVMVSVRQMLFISNQKPCHLLFANSCLYLRSWCSKFSINFLIANSQVSSFSIANNKDPGTSTLASMEQLFCRLFFSLFTRTSQWVIRPYILSRRANLFSICCTIFSPGPKRGDSISSFIR